MRRSHRVFLAENGPGPWPCYGCGDLVQADELLVHHLDEDHSNDVPTNLVSMHQPCHIRLHKRGKSKTEEHRAKIGDALRGRSLSAETRQKMSETRRGKPQPPRTAEHQRKLDDARRGKIRGPLTEEHKRKIGDANRGKTRKKS